MYLHADYIKSLLKGGIVMIYWAIIVMVLAFGGTAFNLLMGTNWQLTLHDIVLFLIALGMFIRIRYMTKRGEKEKYLERITE